MGFLIMRVLNKNEGCNLDDIQKENVESHHNWKVCHCCLLLLSEGFLFSCSSLWGSFTSVRPSNAQRKDGWLDSTSGKVKNKTSEW